MLRTKKYFEDGDFGFYHCRLASIYLDIAKIYSKLNNLDMTMQNLSLSARHAVTFDTMEDHMLTAPLVNTIEYKQSNISKNWQGTYSKQLLNALSGVL